MTTVLLTGAGGSASANFLEALRMSGNRYRVIGADASPTRLHLSLADDRIVIPKVGSPGYLAALDKAIASFGIAVLHAQPDPEVLAIGAARNDLAAATYLPDQSALEVAADKGRFAAVMASAGVDVPESVVFSEMASVGTTVQDMLDRHDTVWIRARRGAGSRASLPVSSAGQAEAWVAWWVSEKGLAAEDFMASEFLPGREFAYQSVWQEGELVAGQARERVEYLYGHLTPHGQTSTPAVSRTVKLPAVDDLAIRAIAALDRRPCGAYCVDLKEGVDGAPKVTEINAGRFYTTSNFFAAAGLNMPDILVQCALGERPKRTGTSPLDEDLYWIRMVDMGHVLVKGSDLDLWSSANP